MLKSLLSAAVGLLALTSYCSATNEQQVLGELGNLSKQPNVIFILTDDQDLQMDSLNYMQHVQKHLVSAGTFYRRHFCTVAICCPSRVNIWTGKAAHNTNVTDLWLPYGGYEKFVQEGLNTAYLPVWLQSAGYNTYYIGKLFNSHRTNNYNNPFPAGWTGSDFLLDPFTYSYLNATFQRNRDPPKSYEGHYSTDVVAEKTFGFLEDAVAAGRPFFLATAPVAPHSNLDWIPDGIGEDGDATLNGMALSSPPVAAKRHEHLFPDAKIPRHANFNPDQPSGVNWIRSLPKQGAANVKFNDHFYRRRLRALQAVDEFVDSLISRLADYGILDNTYIIYTADNGYSISQHRRQPGKECGYEEDINVPLIIRGPGVPVGKVSELVTSHTDLVPTVFDMIGLTPHKDFDGIKIPLTKDALHEAESGAKEHVGVEYWGWAVSEGKFGRARHLNNTYKSLRVIGEGYNLYYAIWCNNVHELYNLDTDPWQMHNIHPAAASFGPFPVDKADLPSQILGLPIAKVLHRLDSLLLILKSCKSRECTLPWETLHPARNVRTLREALHSRFDSYYETQVERVRFDRCEGGYLVDAEGPQGIRRGFEEATDGLERGGLSWSEWV